MQYNATLHKLSNGITVILDPMDVATDEVSVCFHTGGNDETPDEYGLTHFCEHMFCAGTPRFPTQRRANDYMADHGGSVNARTGLSRIEFVGRIVARNLDVLIDFTADRLQNALFDEKVIDNERGVIIEELRRALSRENTKMRIFCDKSLFNLYVPNGKVVLGTPETINSFTRDQMREFIARRMSAHNCLICVSGKIENQDELLKTLEEKFSFLPTHDVSVNQKMTYTACRAHNLLPDRKNVVLEILFPEKWPDTDENLFQNLCIGKFSNCLRQKLFDVLRSENGLTYGVNMTGYGNMFTSVCGPRIETDVENVERVVALAAQTAHKVYAENWPTDTDLVRYKNQNELMRANFLESNADRCDRIVTDWLIYKRMYDFNKQTKLSDSITNADVIKYTRDYFDGPMSIITHGPKCDGDLEQIWHDNFR